MPRGLQNAINRTHTIAEVDTPLLSSVFGLDAVSLMPWPEATNHAIDESFENEDDNQHLWALLINSNFKREPTDIKYYNNIAMSDMACVYTTLRHYGYPKDHIIAVGINEVLAFNDQDLDHSGDNDYFIDAVTKDDIRNILEDFSGASGNNLNFSNLRKLTPEDQLFIYSVGAGYNNGIGSYFNLHSNYETQYNSATSIYDAELVDWVRGIECSEMTLMTQNPRSGGFVEKFISDIYENENDCMCKKPYCTIGNK